MEIELRQVSVFLGERPVLAEVNLRLLPEGVTMLLGRNGAGKTTLMKTILGRYRPKRGQVLLDGRPVEQWTAGERSRRIAYIPQEREIPMGCTALEYAAMGQAPYTPFYKNYDKIGLKEGAAALEELGIAALGARQMTRLSGGEKKLVAIARTRVQKTPWLILDEPTASLDFTREHHFLRLLRKESQKGRGVFLTIHNPSLAVQYADRILVLGEKSILGDFCREKDGFPRRLEECLRQIYGPEILLTEQEGRQALLWKEEEHV
ncbi:ABC transporter ATP-binding protein [Anaerotignum lactatifermentans]|uniref:ABC transporter ATP-binding protein n=1 Tax=Anaerotignum lactatifermentans TaxID=160404 RepID=A0ABS2GBB0_9FIRM|nr:ABC transporter ATP-binding protein [Anaerotignum lactatifermentans]MBM6829431.1 ABC transporter ATP-binding protein [Anaerotignum lactatifermentans]MBM6877789.1 ABC transporter ATP-binding protein [Anaerotignum lactatifermentans]MBM6951008.1 ABC transporter ATP-binding protein [Anaerotignum lactatifermentans]